MTATPVSARAAALFLFTGVIRKARPLDDVWAEQMRDGPLGKLEPRDRAFARALTATALRRLGQVDAILGDLVERLPEPARVTDILRLGLTQTIFLGIAPHAAVGESVTLAADHHQTRRYKGLVNAVLRRASERAAALAQAGDAERLNTPPWLWESWCAAYGEETTRAIARQHLNDPPLDITVKEAPRQWAARLDGTLLPQNTVRRALTDVTALPGFEAGAWWVQDAAAALPVALLGAVDGQCVIDLCAAPGGKTAQLAAQGAQVTAVDRSAGRLARVRSNLDRLALNADLITADATAWRPETPAPAILLDAPCSATGTIRRHPDVAYLKTPEDVSTLAGLQSRLLDAAREMLAPGGRLVYCTCSLQPEEGPDQIAAALTRHPDLRLDPIAGEEIGGLHEALTPEGAVRTLPAQWSDQGGLDGFFIARLTRT